MIKYPHTDEARKRFYIGLGKEVQNESEDALERLNNLMACTTPLAEFEFAHLDNDGSTSNSEIRLSTRRMGLATAKRTKVFKRCMDGSFKSILLVQDGLHAEEGVANQKMSGSRSSRSGSGKNEATWIENS